MSLDDRVAPCLTHNSSPNLVTSSRHLSRGCFKMRRPRQDHTRRSKIPGNYRICPKRRPAPSARYLQPARACPFGPSSPNALRRQSTGSWSTGAGPATLKAPSFRSLTPRSPLFRFFPRPVAFFQSYLNFANPAFPFSLPSTVSSGIFSLAHDPNMAVDIQSLRNVSVT